MTGAALVDAIRAAAQAAQAGDIAAAWGLLSSHRAELTRSLELAWAWVVLLDRDPAPPPEADVRELLAEAWPGNPELAELLVRSYLARIEGRTGAEQVEEGDPAMRAAAIARRTLDLLDPTHHASPEVASLEMSYANALRLAGPRFDPAAEASYRRALAVMPDHAPWVFNLGLFYKNRGRWAEALEQFRRARALGGDDEATLWNVAIAATAAGDGELALEAWSALGLDVSRGPDGLPAMERIGRVKVRIPAVELGRAPESGGDAPEHVWARSISPCHGVVQSPTKRPLAADYGDLIVWDGAPIGWVKGSGGDVPRFGMLARLRAGGVTKLPFRARQPAAGVVNGLNKLLPDAVWIYVFDEEVRYVCQRCIEHGAGHEGPHDESFALKTQAREPHTIEGAVIVEPESDPAEARVLLEPLFAAMSDVVIAIPALYEAVGDATKAEAHHASWIELAGRRSG